MSTLARLWFALPPQSDRALPKSIAGLSGRPLAALVHSPDPHCEALAAELARGGAPRPRLLSDPLPAAIDRFAAEFADREFALVATAELLIPTLALALGIGTQDALRFLPRPGSLNAFHWPTGVDPLARPELVGLDLDWFPPWHPGQPRPRFPGGPGVAGSPKR